MFAYLTKVYRGVDREVRAAQFVFFEDLAEPTFTLIHATNFLHFREVNLVDVMTDFKISDSGELICSHAVREIVVLDDSCLPSEEIFTRSKIKSFYDLILKLVTKDCLFVPNGTDVADSAKRYFPSFKQLRVSKSTMTISISCFGDDRWYSESLVSVLDDGTLQQNPFTILIPSRTFDEFKEFGLKEIKTIDFNNDSYVVSHYDAQLPLCNSDDATSFCEPLIVHYMYMSEVYRVTVMTLDSALRQLDANLNHPLSPPAKSKVAVNRSGIFYPLRCGKITKDMTNIYAKNVLDILDATEGRGVSEEQLFGALRANGGTDPRQFFAMKILMQTLADVKLPLDKISRLTETKLTYSYVKLQTDLPLYNSRVSCLFNPKILESYADFDSFEILGSIYNSVVRVKEVHCVK